MGVGAGMTGSCSVVEAVFLVVCYEAATMSKVDNEASRDARSPNRLQIDRKKYLGFGRISRYFLRSIWIFDGRFGKSTDKRKSDAQIGSQIGPKSA
jgi:hypothetical protein